MYVFTYLSLLKKYIVTSKFLGVGEYADAFLLNALLLGLNRCELDNLDVIVRDSVSWRLMPLSQNSFLKVLRYLAERTQYSRKLQDAFTATRRLQMLPRAGRISLNLH